MASITITNLAALSALGGLQDATSLLQKSTSQLASGLKVARASDNPATFALSKKFEARVASLEQLETDGQIALSLTQTAEAGISTILDHLASIRVLAISSSSGSSTTADRQSNSKQVQSLLTEINSIASSTLFNSKSLLDGTFATGSSTLFFQTGPDAGNKISLNIANMNTTTLGVNAIIVSTVAGASAAITTVDAGTSKATSESGTVGALSNRLTASNSLLSSLVDTHTAAISAMVDVDFGEAIVEQARAQILQASAASALAQANLFPQSVLAALLPSIN